MSTDKADLSKKGTAISSADNTLAKDELSDKDAEKVTGGSEFKITKTTDSASPIFFKN